jgi:hypothetical protein
LYNDVCPTGKHTRLISVLGQQRDGLIDALRGGVIECLQESTSLSQELAFIVGLG